jgi:hypothetical protein
MFAMLLRQRRPLSLLSENSVSERHIQTVPRCGSVHRADTGFAKNNYYKLWLEEKTGLSIEFEFIPQ